MFIFKRHKFIKACVTKIINLIFVQADNSKSFQTPILKNVEACKLNVLKPLRLNERLYFFLLLITLKLSA